MPGDLPNRRDFLQQTTAVSAGIAATGLSCVTENEPVHRTPNIIYIMADDLGYGDLGCYGQRDILTPNIDNLASEGIRFTDHYSGSAVCAPARCTLLTGLHTGHAYIRGNHQPNPSGQEPIPSGTDTVARHLQTAGYRTGIIGKWGLGGPGTTGVPNNQGFDFFYGYLCQGHAHNYWPEYLYRNDEKVMLEGNKVHENERYTGSGLAYERKHYSHDLMADEALSFIERNSGQPFFLYFAPTIPHVNNEAGMEGLEVPDDAPYSDRDWPQQLKNYAAMITRLDRDVGRIMSLLKRLGLDDNTVVLFTSDNGPEPKVHGFDPEFFNSAGQLRGIKMDVYEGGIRVPMIARWPGTIRPGSTTAHASANWDFFPTALDIAGAPVPSGLDGISYLPALTGGSQTPHEHLYWEFNFRNATRQAVRMDNWKAVRLGTSAPIELYGLENDPAETNDVADDHPDLVRKIEAILHEEHTDSHLWELM
ncbi:arylsulfatase [Candidatus Latescibacterota bacterium]